MGTPEQHTQTAQYARNFIHHYRKSHRHLVVQLKPRVGWRQQWKRCWCKQRIRIVLLVQGPKTSLVSANRTSSRGWHVDDDGHGCGKLHLTFAPRVTVPSERSRYGRPSEYWVLRATFVGALTSKTSFCYTLTQATCIVLDASTLLLW